MYFVPIEQLNNILSAPPRTLATGWGCGDCRSLTFLFRSGVFLVDMWSEAFPKPALKVAKIGKIDLSPKLEQNGFVSPWVSP